MFIAKRYCSIFTTDASFRWRLERLHVEHGIYFPPALPRGQTWKALFLALDKNRHLWEAGDASIGNDASTNGEDEKFSVSVYARFKPLSKDCERTRRGRKAVLPLHQRLALIRIDKSLNSNKDALCVLKEQGGWFKEKWDEIEQDSASEVQGAKEDQPVDFLTSGIKHIDVETSRVVVVDSTKGLREFEFDGVMNDIASQKNVYATSTQGLVCDVINGVSATCLVYGQTGSGKTYTMFGTTQYDEEFSSGFAGIVPRACTELMTVLQYRKDALNLNIECDVCVRVSDH